MVSVKPCASFLAGLGSAHILPLSDLMPPCLYGATMSASHSCSGARRADRICGGLPLWNCSGFHLLNNRPDLGFMGCFHDLSLVWPASSYREFFVILGLGLTAIVLALTYLDKIEHWLKHSKHPHIGLRGKKKQ